jgi:hypothetical protein
MSSIKLESNASGTGIFTIASPNSNTNRTLTLPDATGTVQVSGAAISGTTGSFSGDLSFNSGYGSAAVAYGCRAWVSFNGTGTVAIRGSGNVTSITDGGTGDYKVNFTTAMPDANYCTNATGTHDSGTYVAFAVIANDQPPTTSGVDVDFLNTSNSLTDVSFAQVSIFR